MAQPGWVALFAALYAALLAPAEAAQAREGSHSTANPVRRVVQMLQAMEKKVKEEGEREEELFDKFMCYCKTGAASLEKSIADAETKIPALKASMEGSGEQVEELKESLKQAQTDRDSAKKAMAEATGLREKDAAAFAKEKDEYNANIGAVTKAVGAIDGGATGSFVQTTAAGAVRQLVMSHSDMLEEDRQQVLAFLSAQEGSGYEPSGGEITGILKGMGETMEKSLAEAVAAEEKAIAVYNELMSAKEKEVDALTASIETKTKKIGELGVAVVEMKADLDDTEESLAEDKVFVKDLKKSCGTKEAEWTDRQKTRAAELLAIADTVKTLNDDDALELFKKTLPAPSASFVQVQVTAGSMRKRALAMVKRAYSKGPQQDRVKIDLIAVALAGKKVEMTKVIKLIDEMVVMLEQEEGEDEKKRDYCQKEFDSADDKKKATQNELEEATNAANSCKAGIETIAEEMRALVDGIKALDAEVAEQTKQRKSENADFQDLMASNAAAKELLEIAKNRLNKFYNPKLYMPPGKKEGVEFVQLSTRAHARVQETTAADPGAPPETFGEYEKKGEESTGVIAMIDTLIKDLVLDVEKAKVEDKNAQEEYETFMADSAAKRAADSKGLTDKEETKANLESDLEEYKAAAVSGFKELEATIQYISSLHAECDFLMNFFDVRKKARAGEIDALKNGKAVLSGADYSLLEVAEHHHLRHAP